MHVAAFKYNNCFDSLYSKLLFLFPSWWVLQKFGVWFDIYMKCGNLPDADHGKITWKRIRDLLTRRYVLLRRRHDVPIRCCGDVSMRCLNDIPSRHPWVFHLRGTCDLVGTYRDTSLRRRHYVFFPRGYSPLNRDNLTQHIQMELSKKQKKFPQFFFFFLHFWNLA